MGSIEREKLPLRQKIDGYTVFPKQILTSMVKRWRELVEKGQVEKHTKPSDRVPLKVKVAVKEGSGISNHKRVRNHTYFPKAKHSSVTTDPFAAGTMSEKLTSIFGSYSPIMPIK